jgi:ribonuclease P protein component
VTHANRLRRPAEFRRVRDLAPHGIPHPLLIMYAAPNDLGTTRVGITVSGRVGKAVVRNRVRRRLREAIRARSRRLPQGVDVVIAARPASAAASWADLNAALDSVLERMARKNR